MLQLVTRKGSHDPRVPDSALSVHGKSLCPALQSLRQGSTRICTTRRDNTKASNGDKGVVDSSAWPEGLLNPCILGYPPAAPSAAFSFRSVNDDRLIWFEGPWAWLLRAGNDTLNEKCRQMAVRPDDSVTAFRERWIPG